MIWLFVVTSFIYSLFHYIQDISKRYHVYPLLPRVSSVLKSWLKHHMSFRSTESLLVCLVAKIEQKSKFAFFAVFRNYAYLHITHTYTHVRASASCRTCASGQRFKKIYETFKMKHSILTSFHLVFFKFYFQLMFRYT